MQWQRTERSKTRCNRDKIHAPFLRKRDSAIRRIQTLGFHVLGIGCRETLRHSFIVLVHPCVLLHRSVQFNWLAWIERLQIQQLAAIRDVQVPNQHSITCIRPLVCLEIFIELIQVGGQISQKKKSKKKFRGRDRSVSGKFWSTVRCFPNTFPHTYFPEIQFRQVQQGNGLLMSTVTSQRVRLHLSVRNRTMTSTLEDHDHNVLA